MVPIVFVINKRNRKYSYLVHIMNINEIVGR